MSTSSTPIWLELKTEYIDQNFEKVLNFLHDQSKAKEDSFYVTTKELLSIRVDQLLEQIDSGTIYTTNMDMNFAARLIGAHLLSNEIPEEKLLKCNLAFIYCLSCINDYEPKELVKSAIAILLGKKEQKLPLVWDDVIQFKPQLIVHKINSLGKTKGSMRNIVYRHAGLFSMKNGVISISSGMDKGTVALSAFDDMIQIMAGKDEKVKQSEYCDLERLSQFVRDYTQSQGNVSSKALKRYSDDSSVEVKIIGFSNQCILVETIDPDYEKISGKIDLIKDPLYYYSPSLFEKCFKVGDIIMTKIINVLKGEFSMSETFTRYVVEDEAKEDFGSNVTAVYVDSKLDKTGKEKTIWLTDYGYYAFSGGHVDLMPGDFAEIKVLGNGKDNFYGFINCIYVQESDVTFDVEQAKEDLISDFVQSNNNTDNYQKNDLIRYLYGTMVFCQQKISSPSEKYLILSVARILSGLVDKTLDSDYIDFLRSYIMNLVYFATDKMQKITIPVLGTGLENEIVVLDRLNVLKIVKSYGDDTMNALLDTIVTAPDTDPKLAKIASLVLSCNRLGDIVSKPVKNTIKREIIAALSIEMKNKMDLDEENGAYLGLENEHQEFKTSFFHAPTDAKEQDQKKTIFRVVSSFLNSESGGVLYLGVNDMGYVKGIESDFVTMEKNYCKTYKGLDGYVRCILDEAKKYFDIGVLTFVKIVPEYDNKVLAINVKPYSYGVVPFENQTYMRLGSETVHMPDDVRSKLLKRRFFESDDKIVDISTIQEAITNKRRVIFHGYCSSNSKEKTERNVEPFHLYNDNNFVCCYDTDKNDNRIFRIDRIGNVEITESNWMNERVHKVLPMDIFHMSGKDVIHIELGLNLMAKNLLLEEYPESKSCIIEQNNKDYPWILSTDVYSLYGVARFYIGLAKEITIINAPGLKEFVQNYITTNIHVTD